MTDKYVKVSDIEEFCDTNSAFLHGQSASQAALRRVKEYAIENAADVDRWISCKEAMPEDNTNVLFCYVSENGIKSVHYGYHTNIKGIYSGWSKTSGGWQYSDEDITHWQPVPEPPKDGDTA